MARLEIRLLLHRIWLDLIEIISLFKAFWKTCIHSLANTNGLKFIRHMKPYINQYGDRWPTLVANQINSATSMKWQRDNNNKSNMARATQKTKKIPTWIMHHLCVMSRLQLFYDKSIGVSTFVSMFFFLSARMYCTSLCLLALSVSCQSSQFK